MKREGYIKGQISIFELPDIVEILNKIIRKFITEGKLGVNKAGKKWRI